MNSLAQAVNCNNGVLNFNSNENASNIIDELNDIIEIWNETFEANFPPNSSADFLDSVDMVYNFDEEKPLQDFENIFTCYNSLRKKINIEEESWLITCGNNLDENTDPTDNYVTTDEIFQTILNDNSEISIANQIVSMNNWYSPINDLELQKPNGILASLCKAYKRAVKWFSEPGNTGREIKGIISIEGNTPWGGAVDAKTKSYKKRGNRYHKSRAPIFVMLNGNSKVRTTDNCVLYAFLTLRSKSETRKKVKVKERFKGTFIKINKIHSSTIFDIVGFHGLNNIYWNTKM